MERYFPLENISLAVDKPVENLTIGPWYCITSDEDTVRYELLEMHLSYPETGVVFRVTQYRDGDIKLGSCVILDRAKATVLRDRLNALIENLKEEDHDDRR